MNTGFLKNALKQSARNNVEIRKRGHKFKRDEYDEHIEQLSALWCLIDVPPLINFVIFEIFEIQSTQDKDLELYFQ